MSDDRPDAAATARRRARELFLRPSNQYGCAETTLVVLQEAYGLPDAADSAAAMALNGGIAYSGATCGAITGAAIALGRLAGARIGDHAEAKRVARERTREALEAFEEEFGASDCRVLTGVDLSTEEGHEAFIASGAWRRGCMRQVEMIVGRLAPLGDVAAWEEATRGRRDADATAHPGADE